MDINFLIVGVIIVFVLFLLFNYAFSRNRRKGRFVQRNASNGGDSSDFGLGHHGTGHHHGGGHHSGDSGGGHHGGDSGGGHHGGDFGGGDFGGGHH